MRQCLLGRFAAEVRRRTEESVAYRAKGDGVTEAAPPTFEELAGESAVLRLYRQVFAVLAREAGAMIVDSSLVAVDEAILDAFAEAGGEGMTAEQVVAACRAFPPHVVARRFEVLREYGAISKVVDRPNERFHRAAFAPYVMVLFLRRVAERGGQSELHQLLTLERLNVQGANATSAEGVASLDRLAKVFRLLGNELAILAAASTAEALGENAQLLWGNNSLISQAEDVHALVLQRWPELDRQCAALRTALAAYGDAIDAAAGRLIEQAGMTRALGLLPVETWRTFARTAEPEVLAGVLDRMVFDAPAPWFSPETLIDAVESARQSEGVRLPPPRPESGQATPEARAVVDDVDELRHAAERALGGRERVSVLELLDDVGEWLPARRVLAELTAVHHHPDLDYELAWADGVRIELATSPSWTSHGWFHRGGAAQ